ncbi:MAG TPA: type I methionyl aminopeptidase, partial [Gammaproteobacteria bacterium]|nr:type I methionyl aminopeptidase [Gammaproteobacteria bacterium]
MSVSIKNSEQIQRMRVAGHLAAKVLEYIGPQGLP